MNVQFVLGKKDDMSKKIQKRNPIKSYLVRKGIKPVKEDKMKIDREYHPFLFTEDNIDDNEVFTFSVERGKENELELSFNTEEKDILIELYESDKEIVKIKTVAVKYEICRKEKAKEIAIKIKNYLTSRYEVETDFEEPSSYDFLYKS